MQPGQADFAPEGYTEYIYSADKKGYSGTAVWAKTPALSVRYGLDEDVHNHEGRAITLEYPDFYLVNLYVPNAQNELARIDYRMQWEDDLRRYLQRLDAEKPVILCGDLNVAHEDIDLKNPGPNRGAAGFSDQERGKLDELLAAGFTDSFRRLHPDATGMYSWWSMRFRARERNAGWRIDYFLVSDRIADKIQTAAILMDVMMPVMDGMEATQHIRDLKREDAASIPIIAMTAQTTADIRETCRKAGMDAYIAKTDP